MFIRSPFLSCTTVDYFYSPFVQFFPIYHFMNSLEPPRVWASPSNLVCSELVLMAISSWVLPTRLLIDATTPPCNPFSEECYPICINSRCSSA
jgi:hypothetical protein